MDEDDDFVAANNEGEGEEGDQDEQHEEEASGSSEDDGDQDANVDSDNDSSEGDVDPDAEDDAGSNKNGMQDGDLMAELKALGAEDEEEEEEEKRRPVARVKARAVKEVEEDEPEKEDEKEEPGYNGFDEADDDAEEEDEEEVVRGRNRRKPKTIVEDDDFDADLDDESESSFSDSEYDEAPVKKRIQRRSQPVTKRKRKTPEPEISPSGSDSETWGAVPAAAPPKKKKLAPSAQKILSSRANKDSDSDFDPGPAVRGRSTRKVASYAEFEEDKEVANDDELAELDLEEKEAQSRKKKPFDIMAPVEQEYVIDRILDYEDQEEAGTPEDGEVDPEEKLQLHEATAKFLIKWHKRSHRECSWHTMAELAQYKGIKKVTNYVKRIQETIEYLKRDDVGPEETEEFYMFKQQLHETIRTYQTLEKVIAERTNESGETEYLAKWVEQPYAECTWETPHSLNREEDQPIIDSFLDRANEAQGAGQSYNPFSNKETRKPFKRMAEEPKFLQGSREGRHLRDYQLEGLNWLAFSWVNNRNVILADEMGLGKTLQTICCVGWLLHVKKVQGPFLIVVPLSTIAAWQREFARWLPDVNVVVYVGDGNSREVIRRFEFFNDNETPKFNVLLTTPELVLADIDHLMPNFRWALIAVDEAHRLKNEGSSMHRTLSAFVSANRLLITGTPLQNSIRELWALLNFLNPSTYPSAEDFEEKYNFSALRNPDMIAELHAELRPYILRRQKGDVEKSLPRKTYAVLRVGMTSLQQQYYKWILTKNFAKLNAGRKGSGQTTATSLQNIVVELKKVCNHPFLFPGVEDPNASDQLNNLIRNSGKLILLDKLLLRLKEKGHRVLVFSQMVKMLDILQDYCRMRGFAWQRLDGSMANDIRQKSVDHFNAPDSNDFVFLLSTRAGGLGINLATADTVVIFDSDWNPQNDLQAESRAHRIGQKKDVKVFRLLSRDTVEEDILERAKRKRVLEHLVIHGVEGGDAPGKMTFKKEELSAILRFGAERLFEEKNEAEDGEGKAPEKQPEKAMEMDDIDEILERAPKEPGMEDDVASGGSVGDSLLNAFKWADFATEDYDKEQAAMEEKEKQEAEAAAAKMREKEKTIKAVADEAEEKAAKDRDQLSKENDMDFWNRVIPKDEQASGKEEVYLGPRRATKTKTYAEESMAEARNEKSRRRGKSAKAANKSEGLLSRKDAAALVRSFKKFGLNRVEEIVGDAQLGVKISVEDATKLLDQLLADASAVAAENGSVSCAGENVNANDLLTRIEELDELARKIQQYDKDTRFRLPKGSIRTQQARGSKWLPSNDAMLLVGVSRHGFGNWDLMRQDEELKLDDKLAGMNRQSLQRRAATLLSSLLREGESEAQKPQKAQKKGKSSKSGKAQKPSSSRRGSAKKVSWAEILAPEKDVMRELRQLSDAGSAGSDKKSKIRRTRECLISIGQAIEAAGVPASGGWKFIAVRCHTALDGPALAKLYTKLRDKR